MRADGDRGVYVISVAAELVGLHPQTLRRYDEEGLVEPERTVGGARRYSQRDLERLRRVCELVADGLNLAGVRKVLELEDERQALRAQLERAAVDGSAPLPGSSSATAAGEAQPCPGQAPRTVFAPAR